MVLVLETAMSSTVLLSVILIQGVCGTFFPAPENPPPIPGQGLRAQAQQIYIQEDLPPQSISSEGLFSRDAKPDEQRWYIQENQSVESGDIQSSLEAFDRFYPDGQPAIGPVATPLPDDTYLAEPSSISKVNPNDSPNSGSSDIWILTRGPDNQYIPERWVQIQGPSERVVEVVNQESGPVLATDTVKSIVAPAPPAVPLKSQIISDTSPNIVQQVWVQASDVFGSQKAYVNSPTVVEEIPPVKQYVGIPPTNVKQVVTQQITKDTYPVLPPLPPAVLSKSNFAAPPPPPPPAVASKTYFSAPPPPPPPLKGGDITPKVISSVPVNVVPDGNILTTDKSGVLQQIRHIWIPTSTRTGKFISVPVSSPITSGKSIVNKGIPLNSPPVSVSDTWVLKQNGPVPSFEEQKSVLPPSVIQGGKVVFQDPPGFLVDAIPAPPVVAQITSPKNVPVVDKSINPTIQVDLWPPRNDITNSKILGKSPVVINQELPPPPPPKSDTVVLSKSFPLPPPVPQKSIVTSPKAAPFPPPPLPPTAVQIINGKPCPIPPPLPQKSLFPPSSRQVIGLPRIIATQSKQPLTRIVRVNRYPTGSYYLLNSRVRPSMFTYPSPAFIRPQQFSSKPRLVRLVQSKQIPIQVQRQPIIPVQTKQIQLPVQRKPIPAPIPARQVVFPFSGRQIIIPASPGKYQNRIIYPGVQAIRYAYPWNTFLKSNVVPDNKVIVAQSSPVKKAPAKLKSVSVSSESSSSGSSSESSEEEKKEEKSKEEEKPQNEESAGSDEKETEKEESEPKSAESEGEVEEAGASESQSKESIEVAESQIIQTHEKPRVLPNGYDSDRRENKPYLFRFDHRDGNGTVQYRQETSTVEGRVTGTYGYYDPSGLYRYANYVADDGGFRVKLESNEPGTITHESANANFVSNQVTTAEEVPRLEIGESTYGNPTTDSQRD